MPQKQLNAALRYFQVLIVLAVTLCSVQTFSAPKCNFLMALTQSSPNETNNLSVQIESEIKAQDKALWKIDLQHFYENAVHFVQKKLTSTSVRSTAAKQHSRKLQLIHLLNEAKSTEAIDLYRRVFDDVELAYHVIRQTENQLSVLSKNSSQRGSLEKRLKRYQKQFAVNYGEYVLTRSFLQNLTEQVPSEKHPTLMIETAARVLNKLGARKFSETHSDYAALNIPVERVRLSDVKALFNSKSEYTRLKLVADFKTEIKVALRYLISSEVLLKGLDNIINRFPPKFADRLKSAVGLMRSLQLRERMLPPIIEIENMPESAKLRFEELRQRNSSTRNDELMVTYARTVEFSEGWNNLKTYAKQKAELEPDNMIVKDFYARMLKAETRALRLPDISIYEKNSNIDDLYTIIQCGITVKMMGPTVIKGVSDLFNLLLQIPGLN